MIRCKSLFCMQKLFYQIKPYGGITMKKLILFIAVCFCPGLRGASGKSGLDCQECD
jgi:hypothetical protein